MLELNEWTFYVRDEEMPTDGVFACTITDDALDHEAWPIWIVVLMGGKVVSQSEALNCPRYKHIYKVKDMVGWTHVELARWTQMECDTHPQVDHNLMKIH